MNYTEFLKTKQKSVIESGFEIDSKKLNKHLFKFQKFVVKKSLQSGKYAIFGDTGTGKTLMQLEWADVILVMLAYCNHFNIDIQKALSDKVIFNENRKI